MTGVLIAQNITREGPGLLEAVLAENNITFDVVDLSKGEVLPDPATYKAFVVLGGPDSANDITPKMTAELEKVRAAVESGMPYLGICLGLQVLVRAAGGKVVKSPVKEVGFMAPDGGPFTVALTDAGRGDALFMGLADSFRVFHLHGETVELAPDMQLLATGKHCRNQIVKVGSCAYGIQSHFELTPAMLAVWAAEDPGLLSIGQVQLEKDFTEIQGEYTRTGHTLFKNFLKVAGLT